MGIMFKFKWVFQSVFLLILIFSLLFFPSRASNAAPLEWSIFNTPSDGRTGNWVLAAGSDISHLTRAQDGTLYCSANPPATDYRLFKSTDAGYSWSYTGRVEDEIVGIDVLPDNSSVVFYATSSQIFKSVDSGNRFELISFDMGGTMDGEVITSLDAVYDVDGDCLVVGTRDTRSSFYGGAYLLEESQSYQWIDTGIGLYDVYYVAFSPHYETDRQIVAVADDETDIVVTTDLDSSGWNQSIGEARFDNLSLESASLAFPSDYNADLAQNSYAQFVSLNTKQGKGGVFKIRGGAVSSEVIDLNIGLVAGENRDIATLAVNGDESNAYLVVGSEDNNEVYLSADSGNNWTVSNNPPSGEANTQVLMPDDFAQTGLVYAATSGFESAFSVSRDRGKNWVQTGLIDTVVSRILDLALSPDYENDGSLFLLTADNLNSLWLSTNRGSSWERVLLASPSDRIDRIALSPQYYTSKRVFLAGRSQTGPAIWKSEDGGQSFLKIPSVYEGIPVNIDTWAVTPNETLFVGSYDDLNNRGLIYTFDSSNYTDKTELGNQPLNSIVVSSDNVSVLAGDMLGGVYFSTDSGYIFEPLPGDAPGPPFSGTVSIAFDPAFSSNKTIYAADAARDKGIFRFILDQSDNWERIDSTLPSGAQITQIVTCYPGVLYGLNSQEVASSAQQGGIERSLEPAVESPAVFETVLSGLNEAVSLQNLWIRNNTLWAIDAVHSKVWTYTDTLSTSINPLLPQQGSAGQSTHDVTISWETLEGASSYEWQADTYPEFQTLSDEFTGTSIVPSVKLPALDANTSYYWRVRANAPILSYWSETRYFSTVPSFELTVPSLIEPKPNSYTGRQPFFRWSAPVGAEQYELIISLNDDFSDPVIDKSGDDTCNINEWLSDYGFAYNTNHYWRVKALGATGSSPWSAAGMFTPKLDVPKPSLPGGGSSNSITPNFRWSASTDAEGYELLVSLNDTFSNLAVEKTGGDACNTNVWACDVKLKYDTSYYWKIRAFRGTDFSEWSDVAIFTTRSKPAGSSGSGSVKPTPTPTPTPTPLTIPPTLPPTAPVTTIIPVIISPTPAVQQPVQVTPAPSELTDGPLDSLTEMVIWLIGGLVALSIILLVVVISVLKKFKTRY
jgi:photosystem II stability/assembly factor-like uncharacterized protein